MTRRLFMTACFSVFTAQAAKKRKKAAPSAQVSAAARAAARDQILRGIQVSAKHFENGQALAQFFTVLQKSGPVHILQFGDSHTASDDWVNGMRQIYQAKYGDGGPGFFHAGYPFRGYRRFDARAGASVGWVTQGTLMARGDTMDGLSGISISTSAQEAWISTTVTGSGSVFSLVVHFLQQPGGGSLELTMDGQAVGKFSTAGEMAAGFFRFEAPGPAEHQFRLKKLDTSPVRLFGWALDNLQGITFETLGINGAQVSLITEWNEAIWAAAVAQRDPALVILAYGTNEANSFKWTEEQYRTDLSAAISRVRRAAPNASILLVGPPDCGKLRPLRHLAEVIAVQRDMAATLGVAFWDLRRRMGGAGSTNLWVRAGFGQQDHIHLTGEGYRLAGRMIVDDLEAAYAEFGGMK